MLLRLVIVVTVAVIVVGQRVQLQEGASCRRVAGVEWTCRKMADCPSFQQHLKQALNIADLCGTSKTDFIVCCEPSKRSTAGSDRYSQESKRPVVVTDNPIFMVEDGNICKRVDGVEWVCTKLKYCAEAQERENSGQLVEYCRRSGKYPVVCCDKRSGLVVDYSPPDPTPTEPSSTSTSVKPSSTSTSVEPSSTSTSTSPTIETAAAVRKSELMCQKYSVSIDRDECVAYGPQIVKGDDALPKEFPHMALLEYNGIKGTHCGGSLISDHWIISAAHCTDSNGPNWARLGDYDVESHDDENRFDSQYVKYKIIDWINHPKYDPTGGKYANDVALYKLDSEVEFNQFIRPICLHGAYDLPPENDPLISGWGKLDWDGAPSSILQKGKVSYVPEKDCVRMHREGSRVVDVSTTICTNSFKGTSICKGDSGGPLQYRVDNCSYRLVGITSLGARGCEVDRYPSLYTRVSHYISWIEGIVWPDEVPLQEAGESLVFPNEELPWKNTPVEHSGTPGVL